MATALETLSAFYNAEDSSSEAEGGPLAERKRARAAGGGGKAISLLEQIQMDLARELTETRTAETEAAAAFAKEEGDFQVGPSTCRRNFVR